MIKKCKYCSLEFESGINMNPYCSTKCKSRDKFFEIEGKGKKFMVWKKNYEKYPDFYLSLKSYKDRYKNKCFVCGVEYENFSMCCSSKCSKLMKEKTTLETTGCKHNLSANSTARKNMMKSLIETHGIENVFQREDVKEKLKNTWMIKYGYTNPSKVDFIKNKKRKTAEKNGFVTPLHLKDKRLVYEENIHSITWSQMKRFAQLKFGSDIWERISDSRNLPQIEWLTIDHRVSRNYGFINNIPCEIIGHICNLNVITFSENRNKWANNSISIEELMNEIKEFDRLLRF